MKTAAAVLVVLATSAHACHDLSCLNAPNVDSQGNPVEPPPISEDTYNSLFGACFAQDAVGDRPPTCTAAEGTLVFDAYMMGPGQAQADYWGSETAPTLCASTTSECGSAPEFIEGHWHCPEAGCEPAGGMAPSVECMSCLILATTPPYDCSDEMPATCADTFGSLLGGPASCCLCLAFGGTSPECPEECRAAPAWCRGVLNCDVDGFPGPDVCPTDDTGTVTPDAVYEMLAMLNGTLYPCDAANDGPLFMERNFCNDTVIAMEDNGYNSCDEMMIDVLVPNMTTDCQACVSMTNGSWQGCIDYLDTVPVFECEDHSESWADCETFLEPTWHGKGCCGCITLEEDDVCIPECQEVPPTCHGILACGGVCDAPPPQDLLDYFMSLAPEEEGHEEHHEERPRCDFGELMAKVQHAMMTGSLDPLLQDETFHACSSVANMIHDVNIASSCPGGR